MREGLRIKYADQLVWRAHLRRWVLRWIDAPSSAADSAAQVVESALKGVPALIDAAMQCANNSGCRFSVMRCGADYR